MDKKEIENEELDQVSGGQGFEARIPIREVRVSPEETMRRENRNPYDCSIETPEANINGSVESSAYINVIEGRRRKF